MLAAHGLFLKKEALHNKNPEALSQIQRHLCQNRSNEHGVIQTRALAVSTAVFVETCIYNLSRQIS